MSPRPRPATPATAASAPRGWPWLVALWLACAVFYRGVLFERMSLYLRDLIVFYYPQAAMIASALAEGRLPSWEPAVGLGYPFHADPHSLIAYPLAWLLLSLPRGFALFSIVHVPIAGTTFFLLLRRWTLSAPASALGAAVLMFGGFTANLTCHALALRGLAWLPLVLLAFDRYLETGTPRALVAATLALGLEASATDPQYVLFTALLLAAMPWLRPSAAGLPARRAAGGALLACAGAALLLAVQYLPLAQLVLLSTRGEGMSRAEATHFQMDPRQLLGMVSPVPFPSPADPDFSASYPGGSLAFLSDLFWGLPVLALALAALGWRGAGGPGGPGRTATVCALLALAGLLLSFGDRLPFYPVLTTLVPPLGVFRSPAKYFFFPGLAVPLLAALGFDGLMRGREPVRRVLQASLAAASAIALLAVAALNAHGPALAAAFLAPGGDAPLRTSPETVSRLADVWLVGAWEALFFTLVALALVRAMARPGPRRMWAAAGLGCTAVAYLAVNTVATPAAAPDSFLAAHPRTAMLMKHLAPPGFPPRYATHPPSGPLPLEQKPSSFLMLRAGRELMTQARGIPAGCNPLRAGWAFRLRSAAWLDDLLVSSPLLESDRAAAAAGALFSLRSGFDDSMRAGPDALLGQVGFVGIWRLASPTPRVFIAGKARPAAPGEPLPSAESLAALPGQAVFEPEAGTGAGARTLAPSRIGACSVERYASDRLSVRFELAGRGLLVLLEQFYPGWEARVDGQPRPIVPVAGLFRGVEVAEGEHLLEMRYNPGLLTLGWAVSLLTLAGLLMVVWRGRVPRVERSRRRQSGAPLPNPRQG